MPDGARPRSPLISAAELRAPAVERPRSACGSSTAAGTSAGPATGARHRRRATCRARSTSTSTTTSPTTTATARRAAIPSPRPRRSPTGSGAAGIGDEHLVVAYDDVGGWVAARLWWMLDVLGHREVAVLDGGIEAWTAAGGTLSTDGVPAWPPAAAPSRRRLDRRDLARGAEGSGSGRVVLLDARAAAALSRRDRADRPGRRPHPDGPQRPGRRQPRRRPVPPAGRAGGALPGARRRRFRRAGRHVMRERHLGAAPRDRDAPRRPARPDPLRRLVQRLVALRRAGRDGPEPGEPPPTEQ